MSEHLAVWLSDKHVADLDRIGRSNSRVRMAYTPEAHAEFPLGTPLVSLQFPLGPEPFAPAASTAFFENLLPEGVPLTLLAARFGVSAQDVYGLLAALGRDCAGALVIQPATDAPPAAIASSANLRALTEHELVALIKGVPRDPLGANPRARLSLAGLQGKLLLTAIAGRGWSQPEGGAPSTHIVKVPIPGKPDSVANESFCLRLANALALPVPESELIELSDTISLFVRRYDRRTRPDGHIERIHQEDLCQALGVPARKKYQMHGGPSLRQIAGLLRVHDPDAIATLLRLTTFNVVIGNADAHGKNFSLLHRGPGNVQLAPFYDLLATTIYQDTDDHLAMSVADVQRIDRVTLLHLVTEARSWGMRADEATSLITNLLDSVPAAIDRTLDSGIPAPEGLAEKILQRARELARTT